MSSDLIFGEGKEREESLRKHDLFVIVSPCIHKYISNRIVFDFSKCVDDRRGGPLRLQWCNFGHYKSENALSLKARDGKLNFCDDLERGHVEKI